MIPINFSNDTITRVTEQNNIFNSETSLSVLALYLVQSIIQFKNIFLMIPLGVRF